MANRLETKWTDWRPFPDPTKGGLIVAPIGPGCYELRLAGSGQRVLFGSAGCVAYRMTSLHPSGAGTRNNSDKRTYVGDHLPQIEYRVIALASRGEARLSSAVSFCRDATSTSSRPDGLLILLRHEFLGRDGFAITELQHGHRGKLLTSAPINRRRMVAIEFGM